MTFPSGRLLRNISIVVRPVVRNGWYSDTSMTRSPPVGRLSPVLFSYANNSLTQECYESAVVSSKNLCQTRLLPTLHYKSEFRINWLRVL